MLEAGMHVAQQENASYIQRVRGKPSRRRVHDLMPVLLSFERRWPVLTGLSQMAGTALILGAAAMWVLPGAQVSPEFVLLKFGASVFLLILGVGLVTLTHTECQPEAYFDPARRELRVLQMGPSGRPNVVLRRSYDNLGSVQFHRGRVVIHDLDGSLLMRLTLRDAAIRQALRMQLSGCAIL